MQTRSQTRSQVQVREPVIKLIKESIKEPVIKLVKESIKEPVIIKNPVQLYEVDIDFDDASKAWRANKKSIGNGQYVYIREKKCK
jgi:hypothetical protein